MLALGVYAGEGGIQRFNRRIVRSLSELVATGRIERACVASLWDKSGDRDQSPPGVEYHAGGSSKIRFLVTIVRLLAGQQFDVVIIGHMVLVPFVVLVRLIRPGCRRLLVVHGIEAWGRPGPLTRWLVRRWIDPVIAVSTYTSVRMAESFGLEAQRFGLLPCAVDPTAEGAGRNRTDRAATAAWTAVGAGAMSGASTATAADDRPRIVTVSRLVLHALDKNVDKVIAAMPDILRRHPNAEYVVVGDGDWLPALRRLAARIGVSASVRFVGSATDAERDALYARSDLFILPSTQEGFGIVFLEAWLHGLPVVGADAGAAPELLGDGLAGLCVAPEAEVIAQTVSDLLADSPRRHAMAGEGRRRALEQFSHERFRQRLGEILV